MVANLLFITASRLQAKRPRFTDSIPAKKKKETFLIAKVSRVGLKPKQQTFVKWKSNAEFKK
jgi:hypothetical protein